MYLSEATFAYSWGESRWHNIFPRWFPLVYPRICAIYFHPGVHPKVATNGNLRYGKPQEVAPDEVRVMEDVADEGEEGEGECEMCHSPRNKDPAGFTISFFLVEGWFKVGGGVRFYNPFQVGLRENTHLWEFPEFFQWDPPNVALSPCREC